MIRGCGSDDTQRHSARGGQVVDSNLTLISDCEFTFSFQFLLEVYTGLILFSM